MSSVKGLEQLLKGLDRVSRQFQSDVKDVISINIGDIEKMAYDLAPDGGDRIKTENGSISQDSINEKYKGGASISGAITSDIAPDGFSGRVMLDESAGAIGIFVEMGTGQSAKLYLADKSPEWKAYAMRFFITGKGTIVNQPFLLPSFMRYQIQTIKELKQLLKDIKL